VHSQIFSFHFASVKWRKNFFCGNLMRDHAKTESEKSETESEPLFKS